VSTAPGREAPSAERPAFSPTFFEEWWPNGVRAPDEKKVVGHERLYSTETLKQTGARYEDLVDRE